MIKYFNDLKKQLKSSNAKYIKLIFIIIAIILSTLFIKANYLYDNLYFQYEEDLIVLLEKIEDKIENEDYQVKNIREEYIELGLNFQELYKRVPKRKLDLLYLTEMRYNNLFKVIDYIESGDRDDKLVKYEMETIISSIKDNLVTNYEQ